MYILPHIHAAKGQYRAIPACLQGVTHTSIRHIILAALAWPRFYQRGSPNPVHLFKYIKIPEYLQYYNGMLNILPRAEGLDPFAGVTEPSGLVDPN